jgi:hypothetical protein
MTAAAALSVVFIQAFQSEYRTLLWRYLHHETSLADKPKIATEIETTLSQVYVQGQIGAGRQLANIFAGFELFNLHQVGDDWAGLYDIPESRNGQRAWNLLKDSNLGEPDLTPHLVRFYAEYAPEKLDLLTDNGMNAYANLGNLRACFTRAHQIYQANQAGYMGRSVAALNYLAPFYDLLKLGTEGPEERAGLQGQADELLTAIAGKHGVLSEVVKRVFGDAHQCGSTSLGHMYSIVKDCVLSSGASVQSSAAGPSTDRS